MKMKKNIIIITVILLILGGITQSAIKVNAKDEAGVQIWSNTHNERIEHRSINVGGENPNFAIKITPAGTTFSNVVWYTDNSDIADVSGNETSATVYGRREGSTKLNLSVDTKKYGTLSYDCIISVYTEINDVAGEIKNVTKLYRGADSNSWVRTEKANVGQKFQIIGSCGDYYYITMPDEYVFDDDRQQRETYVLKSDVYIPVTSVKVNKNNVVMKKNENVQIDTEVLPDIASNKSYEYKTSNNKVATVDNNGNIRSQGEGFAIISSNAKAGDKNDGCNISVYTPINPVKGTLARTTRLYEGADLSCTVKKDNAKQGENLKVIGKCGNYYYVEFSDNYFGNGDNKAFVLISDVYIPVEKIELSETNMILNINQKKKISVKIYPEIATDKTVKFYSNNGIAKVDADGMVSVSRVGEDKIVAEASSGEKTKECLIQVLKDKIIKKLDTRGTFNITNIRTDFDGNYITFSECGGASEYIVFRKGKKGSWKDIYYLYNNDSKNHRYVFDMGAKLGEKYKYKVVGYYKYITYEDGKLVTKRLSKSVESEKITTGKPTLSVKVVKGKKGKIKNIHLSWKKMSYDYNDKHYKGEYELRKKVGKGKIKKVKTFGKNTKKYKDTDIKKNKTYTYYLRAFYGNKKKKLFPEERVTIKVK